jgi:hypothetical protein
MKIPAYRVIHEDAEIVAIVDQNTGLSITNGAEAVIANLDKTLHGGLGDRRVIYQDTTGTWDELCHNDGVFTGFAHVGGRTFLEAVNHINK